MDESINVIDGLTSWTYSSGGSSRAEVGRSAIVILRVSSCVIPLSVTAYLGRSCHNMHDPPP